MTRRPRKGPLKPSQSAKRFAELVNAHRTHGPDTAPVTNFTFFLGAGFSKAWEASYPLGKELFRVENYRHHSQLLYVERATNLYFPNRLEMDDMKQLVYALDMNAKYPAIRSRYADQENLALSKAQLRAYICNRFQDLVRSSCHWFNVDTRKFEFPGPYSENQKRIGSLFAKMFDLVTGSHGFLEGARLNFITTNYDWLVELIVDGVCGGDDSAFLYLYRGITPRQICGLPILGSPFAHAAFAHDLVFNLLKVNGGFEVFRTDSEYHLDYRPKTQEDYQDDPPILMLPSREQDYVDDYFNSIFPKAVRLLHESKALVIVGYSLPDEDALLRFIIRQFCEDEADAPGKHVFYVDLLEEAKQIERLRTVFPFAGSHLHTETFSGSFATWAGDVAALLD